MRCIEHITREQMDSMPTKRLLALRTRMLKCEDTREGSDWLPGDAMRPNSIYFKADCRWTRMYDELKAVLSRREHVATGDERNTTRTTRSGTRPGRRMPRSR